MSDTPGDVIDAIREDIVELLLRIQELQGGGRAPIADEGGEKVAGVEATFTGDDHSRSEG